jgi:hypothetical protein
MDSIELEELEELEEVEELEELEELEEEEAPEGVEALVDEWRHLRFRGCTCCPSTLHRRCFKETIEVEAKGEEADA